MFLTERTVQIDILDVFLQVKRVILTWPMLGYLNAQACLEFLDQTPPAQGFDLISKDQTTPGPFASRAELV